MIVRISNDGQYDLPAEDAARLEELDEAARTTCESTDEASFHEAFAALIAFVREHGTAVADDALHPSDLILPPADVSLQEARSEFHGDGLIPG